MKTIIIKSEGKLNELGNFIKRLEKYADKQIENAVICSRLLSADNYNTICGELKDAVALNDFDLFIIGVTMEMDVTSVQTINRAHTLVCSVDEFPSAKNYVIML